MALYQAGLASAGLNALFVWPVLGEEISHISLGKFTTALAIVAVLAPGLSLGLSVYAIRNATSADVSRRQSAESAVRFLDLAYFVASSILIAVGVSTASYGFVLVASAFSSAALINSIALARAQDRMYGFALATFVSQTGILVLPLVVLEQGWSLVGALAVLTVVNLVVAGGLSLYRAHDLGWWSRRSAFLLGARLGIPAIPHLILTVAIINGVRAVVGLVVGFDAGADFQFASIAAGLGLTVMITYTGYENADYLRARDPAASTAKSQVSGRRLALLSGALVLAIAALMAMFLDRWLPSSIEPGPVRAAVLLMLPAVSLQGAGDLLGVRHLGEGRTWAMSLATLVGALVMIATVFLAASLGPVAGGLAVTAGIAARALAMGLLLPDRRHISEIRLLLVSALFAVVVATVSLMN